MRRVSETYLLFLWPNGKLRHGLWRFHPFHVDSKLTYSWDSLWKKASISTLCCCNSTCITQFTYIIAHTSNVSWIYNSFQCTMCILMIHENKTTMTFLLYCIIDHFAGRFMCVFVRESVNNSLIHAPLLIKELSLQ